MQKQQAIEFLETIVGTTIYLVDKDQQEEYKDKDDSILLHLPDEFDEKYSGALDEKEQEYYKYPMLKIITNINTVSENSSNIC